MLIIVFVLTFIKLSAAWSAPFLESLDARVDIMHTEPNHVITITMPEEILTPLALAKFVNYDNVSTPSFGTIHTGSYSNLGMSFDQNNSDSNWQMVLNRRQDYENLNMRSYSFFIDGVNGTRPLIIVRVQNIFDSLPTVTQLTNPCEVEENNNIDFESHCIFEVHDLDGMENNSISLSIPNNIISELFEFRETSRNEFVASFSLILKKSLNYDDNIMYMFQVDVRDIASNNNSMNAVVQVKNMPLRPPTWTRPFSSARFPEKSNQTFEISAIDGDKGINDPICYKVTFESENYSSLISIPDSTIGNISVQEINRDVLNIEIYPFNITAYECNDPNSLVESSAVLIVDDINDNSPEIKFDESKDVIKIWESEISTLFESTQLSVNDIDLGTNAMYTVSLSPTGFSEAFSIIPTNGYQLQNFTITVIDPYILDYDKEEKWRNFTITITALESENASHIHHKDFRVILLNWNDEIPSFDSFEYSFNVSETIGNDSFIGNVRATDDDAGDELVYFINGRINETLSINSETGEIRTLISDAFDYERQTDLFFQVFVRDTLNSSKNEPKHTAYTQIHIIVLDVNDTPPQLKLPQGGLKVRENDRKWEAVIEAFDPDTSANLDFFILWDNSTVSGSDTNATYYKESLKITKITDDDNNHARATLAVNPDFGFDIDYEKYHFMYIMIGVEDKGTFVNDATAYAVLTIEVLDENDNAPIFIPNSLNVTRRVTENAEAGIFIGSIMATDIDGPGNNIINYTMIEMDESYAGWLKIDNNTGEITVEKGNEIDCDVPVRYCLDYNIILSDGLNEANGTISISIMDVNDNYPQIDNYTSEVKLYENSSDISITHILAHDADRDMPHNVTFFWINQLVPGDSFFVINSETGELRVKALNISQQMDRDHGITGHSIQINVDDNKGKGLVNRNSTTVRLILLDCNDNAPEMPAELFLMSINENFPENYVINSNFYAPDIDEGGNAEVVYTIQSIEEVEFYGDGEPADLENLFKIENYNTTHAQLITGMDLKGFSGKYQINIFATDKGNETDAGVSQVSNKTYEIEIEPFNFNAPSIIFPLNDEIIRIDSNNLNLNSQLFLLNGTALKLIEAIDSDVKEFGDVTFEVNSDNGDHDFFGIFKWNKTQSELQIKKLVEERTYTLSLKAIDGGGRESSIVNNIRVVFVNSTSNPIFNEREWSTDFTETDLGLNEIRTIPKAEDPKSVEMFEIYYYIDQNYNPLDIEFFNLSKTTGELKLTKVLDREIVDHYEIRIIASNLVELNQPSEVSESSMLYVYITVNDVNDNSPIFDYPLYTVGISELDNLQKIILTLHASDPDLNDQVSYYILKDTLEVSNEVLDGFKDTAFALNSNTGILTLNFQVQEYMTGFFSFKVQAVDLVNHTHEALVRVYTVAERHRVTFIFLNTTEEVRSVNLQGVINIFSEAYNAQCINDDILFHMLADGNTDDTLTDFRAHFLRNDEAVEREEIYGVSLQVNFIVNLTSKLFTDQSIRIYNIVMPSNTSEPNSKGLEISLAIVAGILGLLLIVLIVFHVHKTRNYSREIKALSQTTFDPTLFNKKAVPNTNVHAIVNSNPVMMNADLQNVMDSDTKSIISTESDDFAGLDNNPIFDFSSKENPKSSLEKSDSFA